eukprot:6465216-Amphidinium_carterae.1
MTSSCKSKAGHLPTSEQETERGPSFNSEKKKHNLARKHALNIQIVHHTCDLHDAAVTCPD